MSLILHFHLVFCRFDNISDLKVPTNTTAADNCFISRTYDATSHFETVADDVLELYKRITGTDLDMNISDEIGEDDC